MEFASNTKCTHHTPIQFSTVFNNIFDFDFLKGVAMTAIAFVGSFLAPIYAFVICSTALL